MIPYTNDHGMRDYHIGVHRELALPRWPWLVLAAFVIGLLLGGGLR